MSDRPLGRVFSELLKKIKDERKTIGLDEWENFQKTMHEALGEVKRYKKYTRLGGRAVYTESVLGHTINTVFLCDVMLGIEYDRSANYGSLNSELLRLAARIHDLPEGLVDDIDAMDKKQSDEAKEDNAFELIIAGLPRGTQLVYREAYAIAQEWHDAGAKRNPQALQNISKNGRFFAALEILGYLSRGFMEVPAGNKSFTNIFYNWEGHLKVLRQEFVSVRKLLEPLDEMIKIYKEENPYFKE